MESEEIEQTSSGSTAPERTEAAGSGTQTADVAADENDSGRIISKEFELRRRKAQAKAKAYFTNARRGFLVSARRKDAVEIETEQSNLQGCHEELVKVIEELMGTVTGDDQLRSLLEELESVGREYSAAMDALPPPLTDSNDEDEELGFRASGHGTTESLLDSASYAFGRDDSETETAEQRAVYEYERQGGREWRSQSSWFAAGHPAIASAEYEQQQYEPQASLESPQAPSAPNYL